MGWPDIACAVRSQSYHYTSASIEPQQVCSMTITLIALNVCLVCAQYLFSTSLTPSLVLNVLLAKCVPCLHRVLSTSLPTDILLPFGTIIIYRRLPPLLVLYLP